MTIRQLRCALIFLVLTATIFSASRQPSAGGTEKRSTLLASSPRLLVKSAIHVDLSAPLKDSTPAVSEADSTSKPQADLAQRPTPTPTPTMTPVTAASAAVEQSSKVSDQLPEWSKVSTGWGLVLKDRRESPTCATPPITHSQSDQITSSKL